MDKTGQSHVTVIEVIVGILLVLGGISVAVGKLNLGSLLATIGLLIEIIKELLRKGL